jgi:hypothetical protein
MRPGSRKPRVRPDFAVIFVENAPTSTQAFTAAGSHQKEQVER